MSQDTADSSLTEQSVAPVVAEIAAGRNREAAAQLAELLGSIAGGPIIGALAKGGTQWLSARLIQSATERLQAADAALSAAEREDHIRSRLAFGLKEFATIRRQLDEQEGLDDARQLELQRFFQSRFDELLERMRAAASPETPLQPLPQYLLNDLVPALRNLIRLADDLAIATDVYLDFPPKDSATMAVQATDLRRSIDAYNGAWNQFRAVAAPHSREPAPSSQRAKLWTFLQTALAVAIESFPLHDPPELDALKEVEHSHAYGLLCRQWRAHRQQLVAAIDATRKEFTQLEEVLLEDARCTVAATEAEKRTATRAARALLASYFESARGLGNAAAAFATTDLADQKALREAAWKMAPAILSMNDSYQALESEDIAFRVTLSRGASRGTDTRVVRALEGACSYQWHEVRPLLNRLLVNIVFAVRHEVGRELLSEIRHQQGSNGWRRLASLLQEGSRARWQDLNI